jgi:hypothetical protein
MSCTAIVAAACTGFSSADDPPPAADASSDDSSNGSSDATAADSALDVSDASTDATQACTTTTPIFQDDFESGGTAKWNEGAGCGAGGAIGVVTSGTNESVVMSCSTQDDGQTYSVLNAGTVFPVSRRIDIEFSFITTSTTIEHAFAQIISLFGPFGDNLLFIASSTTVGLRRAGATANLASWQSAPQKNPRKMALGLDFSGDAGASLKITASLDGDPKSFEVTRDVADAAPGMGLQLGVFHFLHAGVSENTYDDVRIWSCP